MTNEPSPRPWRVVDYAQCPGLADVFDASGSPSGLVAGELKHADAALIVDAVNERDRLRDELTRKAKNYEDVISHHQRTEESLRDLVRRLAEQLHDAVKLTPYDAIARDLLREARAAIGEEAK